MKLKITSHLTTGLALLIAVLITAVGSHLSIKQKSVSTEASNEVSQTPVRSIKVEKQLNLLRLTLNQLKQESKTNSTYKNNINAFKELAYTEKSRFFHAQLNSKPKPRFVADLDIEQMHVVLPIYKTTVKTPLKSNKIDNVLSKKTTNTQVNIDKPTQDTLDTNIAIENINKTLKQSANTAQVGYWQTVHSIESKQGKLLFRPRNKSRSCNQTSGPCGHHQLTVQALKDIGCNSLQCRKDRLNYTKSLNLSKKLLTLNEKRLRKNGITKLQGYQKYLIHQQGANGIKNIIAATQGKKVLSSTIKKNMANNSPYSYKQLNSMDSKVAAKKFMQHWKNKWVSEKLLIVASQTTKATTVTDSLITNDFITMFTDSELLLAFNTRF